ncbi:MAG: hypothetical protein K2U26_12750 [Cyclobacteriaceae bacterium]|nr:hypothetical protein [Cyclobacteriaceae bacterium]
MKILRLFFLLILVSPAAHAQIGAKAQQQKIFGVWQNNQFGYQMTLLLNADGTGEFDGEAIQFSTTGKSLIITLGGATTNYTYALQGNSLTLSGGDLDGQVTFTQSGEGAASTPAPVSTVPTPTSKAPSPAFSNTVSNLVGLWSGSGEMIEFKADGSCVYGGNSFPYQVSQGHVILTTGQGPVSFAYTVKGKQLTLTANGQQVVYNSVEGSAPSAGGQGRVAMELVGQWCYMNMNLNSQTSRCIVLNADGTYTYSEESSRSVNTPDLYGGTSSQGGDRGTWYVQGDRIYYNSQTRGTGSYRLEKRNHPKNVNDPMIVLDGEPYVTTTARAPWR